MEKVFAKTMSKEMKWGIGVLLGLGLLTISSFIRIPLYSVPFTLQTLVLFILGLTQSPKQVLASICLYLFLATMGLPVLGGNMNPLWMIGPSGGYLVAMPIAGWLIAFLRGKIIPFFALLLGQVVIWGMGWVWLACFMGLKAAFIQGVFVFIPSAILKLLAALSWVKWSGRL